MTTETKAFLSGQKDGAARVMDDCIMNSPQRLPTRAEVETWFANGQEEADGALLNALGYGAELAAVLGLEIGEDEDELDRNEVVFLAACEQYNEGFREGALSAASEDGEA